ncbi:MAG: helix-turn-helix transcriptional regulator [Lachnospiraceae bacterium]|nr:helix-turn-helix transcriptional regulator [Lachnospiraceae bacterium]
MTLGKYIAAQRKKLRMTQEQLAVKLKVSKSAVAKWETDRGVPDRDNMSLIAGALNTSLESLYRIKDGETENNDVNITEDVIRLLEMRGYKVIAPGKR